MPGNVYQRIDQRFEIRVKRENRMADFRNWKEL